MTNILLYIATVLSWGFSWYAIQMQVGVAPLEVSVAYRFGLAAFVQFVWCVATGVSLRLTLKQHITCALLGVMIFGANLVLVYYATAELPSGLVSVVFSLITVVNIVNGRIFLGRSSPAIVWVAAGLGIVGIAMIFSPDVSSLDAGSRALVGAGFAFAGAYIASLGNIFALKVQDTGLSVLQSNAYGMAYGSLIIAAFAALKGAPFTFTPTTAYLAGLAYLVFGASIAGFGFYLTLIRRIGPERAGYTAVMFPAVALLVSAWLEDLKITPIMMAGAALILLGNVLVLAPKGTLRRWLTRAA
ncbi:MAG: DMT family transporter [Rhodospirillaceae bacterium]|nr:DMT family transporter [Rhodospirillaceae bacterium]